MKKINIREIEKATEDSVSKYLSLIGEKDIANLYRSVVDNVEKPLLEAIMSHTRGNQSRAANCLGVNRATLRSKLMRHKII